MCVCVRQYIISKNLKVKLVVFSFLQPHRRRRKKKPIKIYINFLCLTLSVAIADSEKLFHEKKEKKTSY